MSLEHEFLQHGLSSFGPLANQIAECQSICCSKLMKSFQLIHCNTLFRNLYLDSKRVKRSNRRKRCNKLHRKRRGKKRRKDRNRCRPRHRRRGGRPKSSGRSRNHRNWPVAISFGIAGGLILLVAIICLLKKKKCNRATSSRPTEFRNSSQPITGRI